jgi:hypothetical protein
VVWGGGNFGALVHEDKKWYCISVKHVIFFFIIITIYYYYYYINNLRVINGIYIGIVFGIVFVL